MPYLRSEVLAKGLSQIRSTLSQSDATHEMTLEDSERTNSNSRVSVGEFLSAPVKSNGSGGNIGVDGSSASKNFASRARSELRQSVFGSRKKFNRIVSSSDFTLNKLNWSDVGMEGREKQAAELLEGFEQFLESNQEKKCAPAVVVSITGVSGTGKTLLARSLRPSATSRSCFFVQGKFDLQQRVQPYTALVAAFSDLTEQILTKDETYIARVSERIKDAVGGGAQVLTDFVPSLSKLLEDDDKSSSGRRRKTEAVNEGGVDKIANRVQFIFRQFMRAICAADGDGHPVVMLLDDMQWVDSPSLELLESLIYDVQNPYLMLVTTWRENECTAGTSAFRSKLEAFENQGVKVDKIAVGNLDSSAVKMIVAKTLRSAPDVTDELGELVHHKTRGNAFSVVQFLNSLVEEELLKYNFGTMEWSWKSEEIWAMDVTDNVVKLMVGTLQKLPSQSQLTLQVASCLGESFEDNILAAVMENVEKSGIFENVSREVDRPSDASLEFSGLHERYLVWDALYELADAGFLERLSFSKFAFAHDQIQSAAFGLIPKDKRLHLKLRIGEQLLKDATRKELDERLFLAVDLCNASIPLLGEMERQGLAEYNLLAGERALKKSAFASVMKYMECGLSCLGPDGWSRNYKLALDLSSGVIESAYCIGDFETMEQHMAHVLSSDGAFEQKIRVYLVRLLSLNAAPERFHEGLDLGIFLLRKMGMANFSKSPGVLTVLKELVKTKHLLHKCSPEFLCNLPVVSDQKRIQAMGIIRMMAPMAFFSSPNLFATMFLKAVRWSVKYGVCQHSPLAFISYGLILIGISGYGKEAGMLGEVALTMSEQWEVTDTISLTMIHGYFAHWINWLHESLKPLLHGHQVAMEAGHSAMAMLGLFLHDVGVYMTATGRLDELVVKIEEHLHQMTEYKQEVCANYTRLILQSILNLIGPSADPLVLTGRAMNQEKMTQLGIETKNRSITMMLLACRLQVAFLFGHYESVVKYSELSMDFGSRVAPGHMMAPRHFFYRGLATLALAAKGIQPRKNLRHAQQVMKMMNKWVSNGNVNCLHMVKLLEADLTAVKKDKAASELYRQAVLMSGRASYLQDKALSHYRAGIYHLAVDDDTYWTAYHLDNAILGYHDWGATALVDQLVHKYGKLLGNVNGTSSLTRNLLEMAANLDTACSAVPS